MQDFYMCEPGYEAMAAQVADTACRKLVKDMHYEARVQVVITYAPMWKKGRSAWT